MKTRIHATQNQIHRSRLVAVTTPTETGICPLICGALRIALSVSLLLAPNISKAANPFSIRNDGTGLKINIDPGKLFKKAKPATPVPDAEPQPAARPNIESVIDMEAEDAGGRNDGHLTTLTPTSKLKPQATFSGGAFSEEERELIFRPVNMLKAGTKLPGGTLYAERLNDIRRSVTDRSQELRQTISELRARAAQLDASATELEAAGESTMAADRRKKATQARVEVERLVRDRRVVALPEHPNHSWFYLSSSHYQNQGWIQDLDQGRLLEPSRLEPCLQELRNHLASCEAYYIDNFLLTRGSQTKDPLVEEALRHFAACKAATDNILSLIAADTGLDPRVVAPAFVRLQKALDAGWRYEVYEAGNGSTQSISEGSTVKSFNASPVFDQDATPESLQQFLEKTMDDYVDNVKSGKAKAFVPQGKGYVGSDFRNERAWVVDRVFLTSNEVQSFLLALFPPDAVKEVSIQTGSWKTDVEREVVMWRDPSSIFGDSAQRIGSFVGAFLRAAGDVERRILVKELTDSFLSGQQFYYKEIASKTRVFAAYRGSSEFPTTDRNPDRLGLYVRLNGQWKAIPARISYKPAEKVITRFDNN